MRIIGLMSGTSGDGVDVALCEVNSSPPTLQAQVLHGRTFSYSTFQREQILSACDPKISHVQALTTLNFDLAEWFATAIEQFCSEYHIALSSVDLIASHGQTVWHEIQDGRAVATLQLGTSSVLAERTGITTIADFRARDIACGGQGAPLTGYVDWLLLRHPTVWRAIQNIGGMGNVTFLPPLSHPSVVPIAFDTGPGNALIDAVVFAITEGRMTYDEGGQIAQSGMVDSAWLKQLLEHPFFALTPPKTTGRELFGTAQALAWLSEGRGRGLADACIVATMTALTVQSIARAYRQFAPHSIQEVIVGGGGKHNPLLMQGIEAELGVPVRTHEAIGINSDFKEALVFAVLAHETWHHRPSTLPSQTGARHESVLGTITPSKNYARLLKDTWHDLFYGD